MYEKSTMKAEHEFYDANKADFVKKYLGKEVLIYQKKLQGVFTDTTQALRFAIEHNFPPGKFMIKTVVENEPKMHFFALWSE